jgi:hypothetical protein
MKAGDLLTLQWVKMFQYEPIQHAFAVSLGTTNKLYFAANTAFINIHEVNIADGSYSRLYYSSVLPTNLNSQLHLSPDGQNIYFSTVYSSLGHLWRYELGTTDQNCVKYQNDDLPLVVLPISAAKVFTAFTLLDRSKLIMWYIDLGTFVSKQWPDSG